MNGKETSGSANIGAETSLLRRVSKASCVSLVHCCRTKVICQSWDSFRVYTRILEKFVFSSQSYFQNILGIIIYKCVFQKNPLTNMMLKSCLSVLNYISIIFQGFHSPGQSVPEMSHTCSRTIFCDIFAMSQCLI
jgi:hypothetical protein